MPSHDLSKRKSIFHFTVSKVKGDRGSQNCLDRNNQNYSDDQTRVETEAFLQSQVLN